jgi:hypothetical protein
MGLSKMDDAKSWRCYHIMDLGAEHDDEQTSQKKKKKKSIRGRVLGYYTH